MKKILLSLLLAGGVQNSFVMGSCGGGGRAAQSGGQAAESGFRLEGRIPVIFKDGSVVYLDLQRLKALNSGLLERILFTADGLSGFGESSEDNKLVMEEFTNLADFENFETALKRPLQGEIADMVDFFKKADFLGINTDEYLKGLLARDKAQFVNLCRDLLEANPGFVLSMQRVYPEILHHAIIWTKNFDFAKILIAAGANVKVIDTRSRTALMWAAEYGYTEILQLLIAAHADVNARSNSGVTALILAAENGYTGTAQLLIAANADVNASTLSGWTALMLAARVGHTETVKLLIDERADVNARNNYGQTVLTLAAGNGHTEMAKLLRDAGAN